MGVGQASIKALPIVTCASTIHMTQGPVVLIMNQYDYYGRGVQSLLLGSYLTLVLIVMINPQATKNPWLHPIGGSFLPTLLAD